MSRAPLDPPAPPAAAPPWEVPGALRRWLGSRGPLWAAWVALVAWAVAVAAINLAQPGDHVEQFVWAQSLDWGYPKHPPLPTWMLIAAESVFGRWVDWPYVLAAASLGLTVLLTGDLARRLWGPTVAGLAVLLWGLQQPFSRWAHLYNHNTVLVLAVAATAACVWRACAPGRPAAGRAAWLWWVLAGVAAGAAMLSKYQAVVALAGLAFAALASAHIDGRLAPAAAGLALAAGIAAAVVAPHAVWLLQADLAPLQYAAQHAQPMHALERLTVPLGFAAQQLRMLLPALALAALVAWVASRAPAATPGRAHADRGDLAVAPDPVADRHRRAWVWGLVGVPLLLTVVVAPLAGVRLQNHWGTQALQFAALPLAVWVLRPRTAPRAERRHALALVAAAWLGLHAAGIAEKSRERLDAPTADERPSRRLDGQYPAEALASAVARDWAALSACPPGRIVGPVFEAGLVSLYWPGGMRPPVADVQAARAKPARATNGRGTVHVDPDPARLPVDLAGYGRMATPAAMRGTPGEVHWAIAPDASCPRADPSGPAPR